MKKKGVRKGRAFEGPSSGKDLEGWPCTLTMGERKGERVS